MTTTSTAAETSGADKSKDKIEKRRALGRGLDSLLPGPRAVTPMHSTQSPARPATHLPSQSPAHTARPVDPRTPSSGGTAAAPPRSVVEMSDAEREAQKLVVAAATDLGIEIEEKPLAEADPEQSREGSGAVPFPSAVQEHAQTAHLGEGTNHSAGNERVASDQLAGLPGEPAPVHVADIVQLPLDDIDRNPFQTRNVQSGEPLDELADSIRANGVLQPIVVRPAKEKGRYVLIVGERRLLASRKAGRTTIPVIVRKVSEQQAAEMTIIENLQREDLSPLEQAKAFKTLSEHFHLTQQQIGERVGLSRESVSNYMRLLRLPPQVMQLLAEKRIKFAEAR